MLHVLVTTENVSGKDAASQGFGDKVNNTTNLIVNYLPQTMTDESFCKLFSAVGPVCAHPFTSVQRFI